jgi:hypothetical protein
VKLIRWVIVGWLVAILMVCFQRMVFNSVNYHDGMRMLPNYLGSMTSLSAWGWKQSGTGAIAVEKLSGEDAVFVVVGKVVDSRFRCSPVSNYNVMYKDKNPHWKAKYQLSIGVPDELALAKDFCSCKAWWQALQTSDI